MAGPSSRVQANAAHPVSPNPQKRPAEGGGESVSKIARTAREIMAAQKILPVDELKTLLSSDRPTDAEIKRDYIRYVFDRNVSGNLKPTLRLLSVNEGATEEQRVQARALLANTLTSATDVRALLRSGELSRDALFKILFKLDIDTLFQQKELIEQLLSLCQKIKELDDLCRKATELLDPNNKILLKNLFSALATTINRAVANTLFEFCFSRVGLAEKIRLFCEYAKSSLKTKHPTTQMAFSSKMLERLKEEIKKDPLAAPSSFENTFGVFNPFLRIAPYRDSYFLILLGALIGDQDALIAYTFRQQGEGTTLIDFDKAPISSFHQGNRLQHREAQVPALVEKPPYVEFFLNFTDKPLERAKMLEDLTVYVGSLPEGSREHEQAYIFFVRAALYYALEYHLPLKEGHLRGDYRLHHLPILNFFLKQSNGAQAQAEKLRQMKGTEAKRLAGIIGFLSATKFSEQVKAVADLLTNDYDVHALYYALCILSTSSSFPSVVRDEISGRLKAFYEKNLTNDWDENQVQQLFDVFNFQRHLDLEHFKKAFKVFLVSSPFLFYSKIQDYMSWSITYFLVQRYEDPEYREFLEPLFNKLVSLNRLGFPQVHLCLKYLEQFSRALSARIHPPTVDRRKFVDADGYCLSEVLLSPLPPIVDCRLYTIDQMSSLVLSYGDCIATFVSSLNIATEEQKAALAEQYSMPFGALTEEQRIEGLQEQEIRFQQEYRDLESTTSLKGYISPFKKQLLKWWKKQIGVYLVKGDVEDVPPEQKQIVATMCSHIFRHFEALDTKSRDFNLKQFGDDINACFVRVNEVVRDHYDDHILKRKVMASALEAVQVHALLSIIQQYVGELCTEIVQAAAEGKQKEAGAPVHLRKHYGDMIRRALNLVPVNDKLSKDPHALLFISPRPPQEVIDNLLRDKLTTSTIIKVLDELFRAQQFGTDKTFVNLIYEQAKKVEIAPSVNKIGHMVFSPDDWREILLRTQLIEKVEPQANPS